MCWGLSCKKGQMLGEVLPSKLAKLLGSGCQPISSSPSIIILTRFCYIFSGSIELPKIFPWLGSTQIQVLSATTVLSLLVPHALVIFRVKEKPLSRTYVYRDVLTHEADSILSRHPDQSVLSVADMFTRLWKAIGGFPRAVHQTVRIVSCASYIPPCLPLVSQFAIQFW